MGRRLVTEQFIYDIFKYFDFRPLFPNFQKRNFTHKDFFFVISDNHMQKRKINGMRQVDRPTKIQEYVETICPIDKRGNRQGL